MHGQIMDGLLHELCELVQKRSITHGSFTLASGAKSDYYCDTKKTTMSPRGARLTGEVLLPFMLESGAEAVGGLAMGAAYIATAVAMASDYHGSPVYAFTVRQEQKAHGLKQSVDESYSPDSQKLLAPGRRVAVVDDVAGLLRRQVEVDGGEAHAAAERREIRLDERRSIARHDRDRVALAEARRAEESRQPVRIGVELRERTFAEARRDRRRVGTTQREVSQRHADAQRILETLLPHATCPARRSTGC